MLSASLAMVCTYEFHLMSDGSLRPNSLSRHCAFVRGYRSLLDCKRDQLLISDH